MKPTCTTLILLFLFTPSFSQELRPEIKILIDSIAYYKEVNSRFVGYAGRESKQFIRFQKLNSLATKKELLTLVEHESPSVRCAAFTALCKKDIVSAESVLFKHLYDQGTVTYRAGCVGLSYYIGDIFISEFFYALPSAKPEELGSTIKKLAELDSIVLYDSNIKLDYKSSLIKNLKPDSSNYAVIRMLAKSKQRSIALLKLAEYKKPEDKQIFIDGIYDEKAKYHAIRAVRDFPDTSFYPHLLARFKLEWKKKRYSYSTWRILYQALAKYPEREETIALFDKTIKARNKFRRRTLSRYLLIAATKYPHKNFEKYTSTIEVEGLHAEFLDEEMQIDE